MRRDGEEGGERVVGKRRREEGGRGRWVRERGEKGRKRSVCQRRRSKSEVEVVVVKNKRGKEGEKK